MRTARTRPLFIQATAVLSLLAIFLLIGPGPAASQFLHGSDNEGRMFFINITTGHGTFICNLPVHPDPGVTEIEFDFMTLRGVLQTRNGIFTNQLVDIFNCAPITGEVFNGHAFNGLEYINGVLYGAAIANSCAPSELMILDPYSGGVSPIGLTGVGPLSGLAWDDVQQVLYGVTGCQAQGPQDLVTIDIATGLATVVGPTGITAGSLEFGSNGRLYAGGNLVDGGNFYEIDPGTGAATLIGPTGFTSVTGLAFAQFPLPVEESTWGAIKALYQE